MPKKQNVPVPGHISELHAVGLATRKARGEAAEAVFLARAATFGFGVAKPWGDSEPYDFILDSGHNFWAVQVKSTTRYAESRYRVKATGSTDPYTRDQIDFLIAYIIPENLWYVVPSRELGTRKGLRFYPHGTTKSELEIYREAWCQLACPHDACGPSPIRVKRRCQQAGGGCPLGRNPQSDPPLRITLSP